jgi:superfamily II DNA/RNA helicase
VGSSAIKHIIPQLPVMPPIAGGPAGAPPPPRPAQLLVFVESGSAAQRLVAELEKAPRVPAAAVHAADGAASESKRERHRAMKGFGNGRVRVLAATEGMAHGVDFRGATHVVNASMPADAGAYLHRAGRTGRMGGSGGTVVSLPASADEVRAYRRWAMELGITMEEVQFEAGQQVGDVLALRLGDPLTALEGDAPAGGEVALEAAGGG